MRLSFRPTVVYALLIGAAVLGTAGAPAQIFNRGGASTSYQPPSGPLPILVNDGDSMSTTSGSSRGITFQYYAIASLTLRQPIVAYNVAVTGETLATMVANFATNVTPLYQANVPFVLFILGGGNDIRTGQTGAATYALLQTYVNLGHALGANVKVVVGSYPLQCDIQASPSQNTQMQVFNGDVETLWNVPQSSGGLGADGLADFFVNPIIGMNTYASSAFCNQQYSADGQHGTDLTKSIMGPIAGAAMQPLL